jgi:hypothetical protein
MNLEIHKSKYAKGIHHHKGPRGFNVHQTKSQAMIDITEECGKGKFYKRFFIGKEHVVLKAVKTIMEESEFYQPLKLCPEVFTESRMALQSYFMQVDYKF